MKFDASVGFAQLFLGPIQNSPTHLTPPTSDRATIPQSKSVEPRGFELFLEKSRTDGWSSRPAVSDHVLSSCDIPRRLGPHLSPSAFRFGKGLDDFGVVFL
jgi:hypothetical protein